MKTDIYYFTGTGNTLAVVRQLAEELGNTHLVPIPQTLKPDRIVGEADAIGIAFPVYFMNMPVIVRQFLRKIRISGTPYLFGIATCGEQPGGALFRLEEQLVLSGANLSAGFACIMPENYIGPIDLMGDSPHRQEKYTAAKRRIPEIAEAIRGRKISRPEGSDSTILKFGGCIASMFATSLYNTPHRFHATVSCNLCKTCEQICPTCNIKVEKDTVTWGNSCVQCYACIHWCPTGAIEIGGRTTGKPRYHHPDVTLLDMLNQRGE